MCRRGEGKGQWSRSGGSRGSAINIRVRALLGRHIEESFHHREATDFSSRIVVLSGAPPIAELTASYAELQHHHFASEGGAFA